MGCRLPILRNKTLKGRERKAEWRTKTKKKKAMTKINRDDHIELRLPIQCHLPTRREIVEQFSKKYPALKKAINPVLEACAEETEKLFYELLREEIGTRRLRIPYKYYNESTDVKQRGYMCSC